MRSFEATLEAAADSTRTGIAKLSQRRELRARRIPAVLGLAQASPNPFARPVLHLVRAALARDPQIASDRERLRGIRRIPVGEQ